MLDPYPDLAGKKQLKKPFILKLLNNGEGKVVFSFLEIPELAQLGKDREQPEGERPLARSPGNEERLGHFLRAAGGLPLAGSKATMKPQKGGKKGTFFGIQREWSSRRK